ncbi:MAG TPA: DUF5134 domain-containing protein, partial [Solirubrobacterales bacterium]|nr:DUF5134 domain-containing protein [Solirubrobacterales bacterium]
MEGMSMGGAGGAGSYHGMAMGHLGGSGATPDLLPEWLGILAAVIFLLVAGAHLGHLAMTSGERRRWHVLHVAMALGMASMYAPARVDPFPFSAEAWQLVFVGLALAAGTRWLGGLAGLGSNNPLWLLTTVDLGVMAYMWTESDFVPALTWVLVAYLLLEACLWVANAYRQVDGGSPLIRWSAMRPAPEG